MVEQKEATEQRETADKSTIEHLRTWIKEIGNQWYFRGKLGDLEKGLDTKPKS